MSEYKQVHIKQILVANGKMYALDERGDIYERTLAWEGKPSGGWWISQIPPPQRKVAVTDGQIAAIVLVAVAILFAGIMIWERISARRMRARIAADGRDGA